MMLIDRIYCDLDGVLANFDKGVHSLVGKPIHEINDDGIIWKAVAKAPSFWEELEWMHEGEDLWRFLCNLRLAADRSIDLHVLTGTPSSKKFEAETGKFKWCREKLSPIYGPEHLHVFMCLSKSKYIYATPSHLLIDDRVSNIESWRAAGGVGILHTDVYSTIREIEHFIKTGRLSVK